MHPDNEFVLIQFYFILFILWPATPLVRPQFLDKGLNPCPQHWQCGVLVSGPTGKSHDPVYIQFFLTLPRHVSPRFMLISISNILHLLWGINYFFSGQTEAKEMGAGRLEENRYPLKDAGFG